jgi:hypothetical protein
MSLTVLDLQRKLQELLSDVETKTDAEFQAAIRDCLHFLGNNYTECDSEAQKKINQIFDAFAQEIKVSVEKMSDGPQKRQMARQVAIMRGEHFRAEALLRTLESETRVSMPLVVEAKSATCELLQILLDVLFDATRKTQKGTADFAKTSLSYWAVDEVLMALHLACRGFSNQAYAHIRTALEMRDKIELFHQTPEWADVWCSDDKRRIRKELSASAVRLKLGRDKYDPAYSHFSEVGTHAGFDGVRMRSIRREGRERPQLTVWVGGSSLEQPIIATCSLCVHVTLALIVVAIKAFVSASGAREASESLKRAHKIAMTFLKEQYCPWAVSVGIDPQSILEIIGRDPFADAPLTASANQ